MHTPSLSDAPTSGAPETSPKSEGAVKAPASPAQADAFGGESQADAQSPAPTAPALDLPRLILGLDALCSSLKLSPDAREAMIRAAHGIGAQNQTLDVATPLPRGEGGVRVRGGDVPVRPSARGPICESPSLDADWPEHLEDLGRVGLGGLGEVRRVLDRDLNRVMVMKLLRADTAGNRVHFSRFLEEAQVTAQLQHPGIVPVHGLGRLRDGRVYFTMKEIQGRTLDEVIRQAHRGGDGPGLGDLWQLVDVFRRVCDAVAYAHSRGVIHRDIKPANIMVGAFGEVLVLDWGLGKVLGTADAWLEDGDVVTERSSGEGHLTHFGAVVGTPAFMAPEQARGQIDRLSPATDVYALGATLFQILAGQPAFGPGKTLEVLRQVIDGALPPAALTGRWVPQALRTICLKAMSREIEPRYPDAGALAAEIGGFLEGAKARERANEEVRRAEGLLPRISRLRERAEALREGARERLAQVPSDAPSAARHPGWFLEDEAARLDQESELVKLAYLQSLRTALNHDANHRAAHRQLASFYRRQHADAERRRDRPLADQFEVLIRAHDRGEHRAYLRGVGRLTLPLVQPATVCISAYVLQDRQLVLEPREEIEVEGVLERELAAGSYLLEIASEGHPPCRYPILIERLGHCRPQAPGEAHIRPLALPSRGALGPGDVFIPEGSFVYGGDAQAHGSQPRRRLWLDSFVMGRFPVTNGEYLAFLNDLVARGRMPEALSFAPRERGCADDGPGPLLYGQYEDGRFYLRADPDGDLWQPDWPVLMVNWFGARAYARWLASGTGLPWQLPTEAMWEKAARGVDGRFLPFGDFLDPAWANVRGSRAQGSPMASIHSYPTDESPFGVRGMAGNALDWCEDLLEPGPLGAQELGRLGPDGHLDGPFTPEEVLRPRVWRGGSFGCSRRAARLAKRDGGSPLNRDYDLGFRLARWV